MKYIFLSFFASFIAVLQVNAYDTVIDNFKYDWDAWSYDNTGNWGAITMIGYKDYSKLSEDLVIPSSVKWNTSSGGTYGRMCRVSRVYTAAFRNCSKLKSVKLPYVIRIFLCAFENCVNLKKVYLSDALQYIESCAFAGCSSIKQIIVEKSDPPSGIAEDAFDDDVYNNATLYVPVGTINAYKKSSFWSKFTNITDASPCEIYDLKISSTGNGKVSYNDVIIRNQTESFSVNEKSSAILTFIPDEGNRIRNVKVNNTDVTLRVVNNAYTISSISSDTSVEVEFELIPTTYNLFIKAIGSGYVTYDSNTIRSKTSTFTVNEGTSAQVTFVPDAGYRIKSVKLNNADVTSSVSNNLYTISNISDNTTLEVEFEAIPVTTYSLSITATGNGHATYGSTTIRSKTSTFTVNEGTSTTISFSPDNGYRIKSVKLNNVDVTASVTNNQYTISNISTNLTLEVEFESTSLKDGDIFSAKTEEGIDMRFKVISADAKTCQVGDGINDAVTLKNGDDCITIPSVANNFSVISIGNSAFRWDDDNEVKELEIPPTVERIGTLAFSCLKDLRDVYIRDIEAWFRIEFYDASSNPLSQQCGLNIIMDNQVSSIQNLIVPTAITSINNYAFYGCYSIKSVTLHNQLTSIGSSAFANCKNSTKVTVMHSEPMAITDNTFTSRKIAVLHVPYGCKEKYENANYWKEFKEIVEYGAPTSFSLSITASTGGNVTYLGNRISGTTQSFTIDGGTSATLTFTPDNGYYLKSVKVNAADVTSDIKDGTYTISRVNANMTVEITFDRSMYPHPYAVLSDNNTVLTFYYDDQIDSRGGMSVEDLGWLQMSSAVTTVQFDSSFASYRPTSTAYWFSGMSQLTTLDLTNLTMTSVTNTDGMFQNCSRLTTIYVNNTWPVAESAMTSDGSSGVSGTDMFSGCRSLVGGAGTLYDVQHVDYSYAHIDGGLNNPGYFTGNTMYSLSIKATGNGYATYNSTTIRGESQRFSVIGASSVIISFTPDEGYRLKSVKLNNVDVTASVTNGQYTIYNINDNTTLEVEFEAIPVTTYSLSITATGNGYATYGSTTIRSKTSSFTVNEGTSAQITFVPDNGYRIAKVLQDDVDVTASVVNNKYTINGISANITLKVTFEEIPPTTYTLTITTSGNGSVTYENITLQNQTKDFTVTEGTYATLVFTPESGYRVASVKVNWATISPIEANQYTINNITSNTTVVVTFEPIPVTAYSLSITASGNGSATFNNTTIRNKTQQFSVVEGTNVLVTFSPDNGHSVGSVKVNGADVTNEVAGNSYEIKNFSASTVLEVVFIENVNALTVDGVNYSVNSQTNKTVIVVGGNYGQVLTVPATFTQYGTTWTVTGIETDALKSNSELAAVMWDAEAPFTATVSNPNLLLYVKAIEYANNTIKNVIVNGLASNITLYDASNGNNFCCPKAFLAHHISYTHHYGMITGINEAKGWETIALPFDVQTITHASKGKIVPFATWQETNSEKPFWLYEMTGTGFVKANSIKAQIPYIISMPNNSEYYSEWLLNGNVTFAASEVYVYVTDELQSITSNGKSFYPCFTNKSSTEGLYALNVNNDYAQNNSGTAEGSRFVLNMRQIHPFEAYMTTEYASRTFIPIFEESTPTDIPGIMLKGDTGSEKWHTLDGLLLQSKPTTKGVYILNGKKVVVK